MCLHFVSLLNIWKTRTTRTPAFWGYPPPPGSQVKRRQSQSYKFKDFAKISNFLILQQTLHATHLLKLLNKMCKYQMDLTSIVEDTEQTWFCPETDRRTRWKQYTPPFNFVKDEGIINLKVINSLGPGRCGSNSENIIFKLIILGHLLCNCSQVNTIELN